MIINSKFKIWMATDASKNYRPALNHVNIEDAGGEVDSHGNRPGRAIGMNGFIIAVVPVVLQANDVPGMVQRQAWDWMVRTDGIKKYDPLSDKHLRGLDIDKYYQMTLSESVVMLGNGVSIPRTLTGMVEAKFPEWVGLFDLAKSNGYELPKFGMPMTFDYGLLTKLSGAMGDPHVLITQLYVSQPCLVESVHAGGYPNPPYGLMMPMHLEDGNKKSKRWKTEAKS